MDVVVPEFVRVFRVCDDVKPVAKLLLFQVFFGEVLQVALRKVNVSRDVELGLVPAHGHVGSEVLHFSLDFDPFEQELFKGGGVHDAIVDGLRTVDGELFDNLLFRLSFGLQEKKGGWVSVLPLCVLLFSLGGQELWFSRF